MRRLILSAFVGMIVLVAWGMLFWGVLANQLGIFQALPNAKAVTQVLTEGQVASGTYFMPWPKKTSEEFEQFELQHKSGPFYRLSFVREGVDPSSPMKLLLGCFHYLTVAAIGVLLVLFAEGRSYLQRASVVILGGLLGSNFITVGDPIWFHMPWHHSLGLLAYEVFSWIFLGLTLAGLIKARKIKGELD